MWLSAFIWVLAHKEKDADITSKTKSQPKQKGFRGFLLISHISTKLKKNHIKPEMIAWAIQRAGYNVVAYLSEHPDVDEWYKQEKQPTEKQLEDLIEDPEEIH